MNTTLKPDGSSKAKVLITSIIFMGLSHILYFKQYVKGLLFSLVEIIGICLTPFFIHKIYNLITLGFPQPDLPVKQRSNSIFMLI
ncbi:MAG TPA: sugar ABC transporter permease, partial [Lachnospiraceae bacterium]|nr:sugar ABC transporter permease [Lachnospiraceae bacterium]